MLFVFCLLVNDIMNFTFCVIHETIKWHYLTVFAILYFVDNRHHNIQDVIKIYGVYYIREVLKNSVFLTDLQ